MTDEEKLELFERHGITEDYIEETERQIESGEYFKGNWDDIPNPSPHPVTISVTLTLQELYDLNRRAMRRKVDVNELARSLLSEGMPIPELA